MIDNDPNQRMSLLPIEIVLPKRRWPRLQANILSIQDIQDIGNILYKNILKFKYSNATLIHTFDIVFRYMFIKYVNITFLSSSVTDKKIKETVFAALILASNWGEFTSLTFDDKHLNYIFDIMTILKGLIYIPGLEYMEQYSHQEIFNEIQKIFENNLFI